MNFLPRLIQSQQAGGDQSIHFEPIAATLLADFIRYSVGLRPAHSSGENVVGAQRVDLMNHSTQRTAEILE